MGLLVLMLCSFVRLQPCSADASRNVAHTSFHAQVRGKSLSQCMRIPEVPLRLMPACASAPPRSPLPTALLFVLVAQHAAGGRDAALPRTARKPQRPPDRPRGSRPKLPAQTMPQWRQGPHCPPLPPPAPGTTPRPCMALVCWRVSVENRTSRRFYGY